jgi:hypothetical protein
MWRKEGEEMELLKWLVLGSFFAVAVVLTAVVVSGRRIGDGWFHEKWQLLVQTHKRYTTFALGLALAAILATEAMVQLMDRSLLFGELRGSLFWVHLPLAAAFFLLFLALRFRFTGLRAPRAHRALAYACLALYGGALGTGVALILGLPKA